MFAVFPLKDHWFPYIVFRNISISTIYNSGSPSDLTSLSPDNWWRMGDGDNYPTIQDVGSQGAHMIMYNMTAANIVTDVP